MVLCRGTRRVRETRKRGGGQISKGGPPLTFWNSPWNWNNPWGFKDPISASHIRDCTGFTTRCQLTKGPYNRSSNNLLQPVSICKSVNLQCSIHNKRVVIACAVGMMGHKNNPDQNVKKNPNFQTNLHLWKKDHWRKDRWEKHPKPDRKLQAKSIQSLLWICQIENKCPCLLCREFLSFLFEIKLF